jgi:hypothetical protein
MPVTSRLYEKSMSAIIATPTPIDPLNFENKSIAAYSTNSEGDISITFLTYDTNINKTINTGYNSSGWSVHQFYPLNNSGYVIYLHSTSGPSLWAVIFYDYEGNEVGKYTAEAESTDYGNTSGKFAYFIDYDNKALVYSDGKTYQVYNYNPLNNIQVLWWYSNVLDNGFVINEYNINGTNNLYAYSLATSTGVTQLGPALNGNIEESSILWYNSNKFLILFHSQLNSDYQYMSLFSNTGQFIRDIFLPTGETYNNYNIDFYGTNKVSIMFYNGGDNTVPYLIYNYDGNRDKLLMTYHDRNPNFSNYDVYYRDNYNGVRDDQQLSEDIHYIFYGNEDGWDQDLYVVGYADVLSVFDGDLEFREPYVVNSSGNDNTSIGLYSNFVGSSFIMPVVDYTENTPMFKLLNIQNTTSSYTNIRPVSELDTLNVWTDNAGDNYIFTLFTNYSADGTIYVVDGKSGNLRDSKVFTNNIQWWYDYDTMYFTDYGQEGNVAWYMNSASSKFQSLDYDNSVNIITPDRVLAGPPFTTPGNIMLYNPSTGVTRVITRTNFYNFNLPVPEEGYNISIGNDVILYNYYANESNSIVLYNLKGQYQQASVTAPTTSTSNFNVVGNRAYFRHNNGNDTYTIYTLKPGKVQSSTLTDYNYYPVPNDYYWWNW